MATAGHEQQAALVTEHQIGPWRWSSGLKHPAYLYHQAAVRPCKDVSPSSFLVNRLDSPARELVQCVTFSFGRSAGISAWGRERRAGCPARSHEQSESDRRQFGRPNVANCIQEHPTRTDYYRYDLSASRVNTGLLLLQPREADAPFRF